MPNKNITSKKRYLTSKEITKDDLQSIEILRQKINNLVNADTEVKKIAHLIHLWLENPKK